MVKRSVDFCRYFPPRVWDAPVLDLMCSHFVLTLAAKQGGKFNVRRDLNGLLSLAGRHLVWPAPALQRLREFLTRRCKDNEFWRGHEALSTRDFLERHGVWRGPYEEGTLFFYLDEYAKDAPKDLLAVLAVTGDWLTHALKKHSTLVEKNINALSGLLQLNKAERALLLYGTLARYQRDLRSILVEFKVNNAPEAYAAIADIAGVNATEVGEALRAGSRLERIGLVENLISEHNITDLADLMKVSEKLPPVLMREYRDQSELMAVFTRPAAQERAGAWRLQLHCRGRRRCCARCCARRWTDKAVGVNVLLYGPPGTGKTELAKVVAQAAGVELFEVEYADRDGNSAVRPRPLPLACRSRRSSSRARPGRAAVRRGGGRVSAGQRGRGRPDGAPRAAGAGPASHSVSGKAWVNQILESNPVPTIWVTNRIEQIDPAFRRRFAYHLELKSPPPGAREQLVRKTLDGVAVSEAFVARLTGRKGLTPAQIRTAVRFAGLAHGEAVAEGPGFEALDRAATEERRRRRWATRPRRAGPPAGHHLGPGDAQRRDPLRDSAHRRGAEGARPRHAVFLRRARHRQDRAGRTHCPRAGAAPDRQAGQRPHEQVRRRDRAEHGRHVPRGGSREGGAAAGRGRQLSAGPPWRPAHLRGDRGERDAARHGAFQRHLHLHHQPAGPARPGGACAASPSRSSSSR
jgi:hypothetical protein